MAKVDRQQNPWRVLNSSNVYKNQWITVEHHGVLDPSGSEAIPRRHRLTLLINLAFEDCKDPTGKARNATEAAFVINATETGGVLYDVREHSDIAAALNIVRQAYESIAE
jgi:hypothetical protein